MPDQTNIAIILYAITIYQVLFFTVQLISFRKSNPSRMYLGLLLFGITVFLLLNALFFTNSYAIMVWLYPICVPVLLTLLPLFYLYIRSLMKTGDVGGIDSKLILFIPPIVVLILNFFTFGISPVQKKLAFLATDHTIFSNSLSGIDNFLLIFWFGIGIMLPVQLALASSKIIRLIRTRRQTAINEPAQLAYLQFGWVNIISISLMAFMIMAAAQILLVSSHSIFSSIVFNVTILISTGLLGYYAMKQDDLFTQVAGVGSLKQGVASTHIDIENKAVPDIPEEEVDEIIEQIRRLMEDEKPYLVKSYGLNDLSRQTGVRRQKLTSVLNEVMDTNFSWLINEYRIREAICMLEENHNDYTIDTIADMVGFRSRSSFYACFKKYTGKTPKEFLMDGARGSNGIME